jgi:hypothetical protein
MNLKRTRKLSGVRLMVDQPDVFHGSRAFGLKET